MTEQKKAIDLTPAQIDTLGHDVIDLLSQHGSFTGSKLHEAEGDHTIELTAFPPDNDDLAVITTVYIRGEYLKELQEGGE